MCPVVQPVKEDQREYSLLLRWLGLALMVVSMKRKRLVGRRRSFWHRMVECCECSLFVSFFAFHLFSSLHLFSLFTRLVTFVHAYKIYIVVVQRKIILFHLTFFSGLNFSVLTDTHKWPSGILLLGNLVYAKNSRLHEQIEKTMILTNKDILIISMN